MFIFHVVALRQSVVVALFLPRVLVPSMHYKLLYDDDDADVTADQVGLQTPAATNAWQWWYINITHY